MQTYSRHIASYILDEIGRIGLDKCFNKIAEAYPLSDRFLMEVGGLLDMYTLSSNSPMDVMVYNRYKAQLNWEGVTEHIKLDRKGVDFLAENADKVTPIIFIRMRTAEYKDCEALSTIIKYYLGNVLMKNEYWKEISTYEWLTAEFIEMYEQYLDWYLLSQNISDIPMTMILAHKNDVDWRTVWVNYKFTDKQLNKLIAMLDKSSIYIDWCLISSCQQLSESFMNQHSTRLNWAYLSEYQYMTLEFMKMHNDDIVTTQLLKNQVIPKETIDAFLRYDDADDNEEEIVEWEEF